MRSVVVFFVFLVACDGAAWARQGSGSPLADAERALRAGNYDDAISGFRSLSSSGAGASDSASIASRRGLLRALSAVGRYEEAEEAGRRFVGQPGGEQVANALGEVLVARGKLAAAESLFTRAAAAGSRATDSLTARVNLAQLLFDRGERDEAMRRFDEFIDVYNSARRRLTAAELMAVGASVRYLGRDNPQLFKDALKAYDEAIAADSTDPEPRLRVGQLFLEKYNGSDAQSTLADVLRMNPRHARALVAEARRMYVDGQPGGTELVRRALSINPNLVEARTFLAQLHLDAEDHAEAAAEATKALEVDPRAPQALALLAATRLLQGDSAAFEEARRRASERNPRDADFYATLAEVGARNRLYREAAAFARQATERDPKAWRAWGMLGMNQLRIGEMREGRASLERAFAGDPYDVWIKNTLDLLDATAKYPTTTSPRFQFVIDSGESELLTLYMRELAEAAYDSLAARYGYRPPTPVRLEVYRSHADFSVRTVGLPGLGALGVAFGPVMAMNSPSAHPVGDFNWGSTLWHELAHVFTLGMTDHRVPRWFSEGLSVYEERRARRGWGADVTPDFLVAFKAGRLAPASRMNDGFMRPRYPAQVIHSYYQASLVCEMIEREHGVRALVDMLNGYKAGLTTPQILERVLKTDPKGFDARFEAYVRQRFAAPLAAIEVVSSRERGRDSARVAIADAGEYASLERRAITAYREKRFDDAAQLFGQMKRIFPEWAGPTSAYWHLARIHRERGDLRGATAELRELVARNESDYESTTLLAELLLQQGDTAGAAATLDRAMYISPADPKLHATLAVLASRIGDRRMAVRERAAIVAMGPVDEAEARYQLALAHYEAGDVASARREVLRALEVAPSFERAQELLLRLRTGSGGRGGMDTTTEGRR